MQYRYPILVEPELPSHPPTIPCSSPDSPSALRIPVRMRIPMNGLTMYTHTHQELILIILYLPVGVTQIKLVAHRGDCTDTAVTYVINNGTPPTDPKRMITSYGLPVSNEWANGITQAKTDGYLLAGVSGVSDQNFYTSPYFVRVSETGCILWTRMLHLYYESAVQSVISTYDGGFVAQVLLRGTLDATYFVKFDKDGNIVWAKIFRSTT